MAIVISPSAAASLTSGFSYSARSVFRFLSLARSNRADHPRWYVGPRDYLSLEVRRDGSATAAIPAELKRRVRVLYSGGELN